MTAAAAQVGPERVAPSTEAVVPAVLRVEHLVHSYGERRVLNELAFEVKRGQVFGLLGPNGAGKTTAFHIITGLLAPTSGYLYLNGFPVEFGHRRLRASMGVVFQGQSLDAKLSGRENLLLAAALHGIRGQAARSRADELLKLAGLDERAHEQVGKYSGGMRRRLEIARALMHRPQLLVLDEPTSGLDEASFQRIWAYLHECCRSGLSILLTTHRPEEAERCDSLGILSAGKVVTVDTPERIREQVSGDIVVVDVEDPVWLAREVANRFSCRTEVLHRRLLIECELGHQLIPRLVEAFPPGKIEAVSLRRPTLADAFLRLTGVLLDTTREET